MALTVKGLLARCPGTALGKCRSVAFCHRPFVFVYFNTFSLAPGGKVIEMEHKKITTLGELKENIESTVGKKLPTAKALLNSGERIVAEKVFSDGNVLYVYESGFALYKSKRHKTVFRVDRCGGYTYYTHQGDLTYCEGYFDQQDWAVRLLIEAEDRIQHNLDVQEEKHGGEITEEISSERMETQIENMELLISLMEKLTPTQRRYFYLHYMQEYRVQEIATMRGVTTGAVSLMLQNIKTKLNEKFKNH